MSWTQTKTREKKEGKIIINTMELQDCSHTELVQKHLEAKLLNCIDQKSQSFQPIFPLGKKKVGILLGEHKYCYHPQNSTGRYTKSIVNNNGPNIK